MSFLAFNIVFLLVFLVHFFALMFVTVLFVFRIVCKPFLATLKTYELITQDMIYVIISKSYF